MSATKTKVKPKTANHFTVHATCAYERGQIVRQPGEAFSTILFIVTLLLSTILIEVSLSMAADLMNPKRHEPRNIVVQQINYDGSLIPWAGTAKNTEVRFSIQGDVDPSPNVCAPRGVMEIELRDGHEKFQNKPNVADTPTGCVTPNCLTPFANRPFNLQPKKPYKWQARLVAIYDIAECKTSGCHCTGREGSRFHGYWNAVGLHGTPGYFSFFTP